MRKLLIICVAALMMGTVTGEQLPPADLAAPTYNPPASSLNQPGIVDWRAAVAAGNYEEAARLLRPRARKGDPDATLHLGVLYYRGLGLDKDYRQAAWWFKQSADRGNVIAMNDLGTLYRDGNGVCRDYLQARKLFEQAAMHGFAPAQNNLAAMLANGQGGPREVIEAYAWMKAASDQGQATGQFNLLKIEDSLSRCELYEAMDRAMEIQDQVEEYRRKNGECGMPVKAPTAPAPATIEPAMLYAQAYEACRCADYRDALRIIRPLAEKGNSRAQVLLGVLYSRGYGVPQSDKEALSWYSKAAKQNDMRGLNNVGVFYRDGRVVPHSYSKAAQYFRRAALLGDDEAQNNLGMLFGRGQGVPQDPVEAYAWLKLSAKQGNRAAVSNLTAIREVLLPEQQAMGNQRAEELQRQILRLSATGPESD